ncbi:uncharacterized protein HMPREF1541_04089 [Cyphellophora europaea CBS 101466]|uniref:Peptidase A1 domain-containing protein n=1 Tax=Cyphellophora europaea (strain CBS 101466) TaxID=1220924 RepID=W2S273_CYPE1|nr:uncharacterized protein HMPREF1541_04089 [Cyphellophora europaea CBS 101466]ETN42148.1 hypothetical protein HMPREF1541_04089 [Cyphellophora europaea CBS 101466]
MSRRSPLYTGLFLATYICGVLGAKDPQPIVCTTSTEYVGYDGQWSPITIRVGTPEQWLSVLPSTLSQETWVMGTASCDGTTACATARGGVFYSNQSSTFQGLGFYELGSDPSLNNSQFGYYGLDTIALNDDVSEVDQIVAILNTSAVWVGEMGLGVQQTRINGSENRLPLLSSLVQNDSAIPSHSYGYTAGAAYRLTGVPASLTLGGVDANRFTPNNLSFVLSSDYAPAVAVNSITVSSTAGDLPPNWNLNPMTLLQTSQAAVFTIDSSTPYLWLPEAVCDNFAEALNLTYNETLGVYVFANESASPDDLQNWNLTFTFNIGKLPGSTDNVELTLPYSAFNLDLTYGFPNFDGDFNSPPLPYFPIRRTRSQFIIGRVFLQEAYLMVDYERNSFTLSQAVISEESVNNVNLQAITRPSNSIFPGPDSESGSGLSTGAKAGIGVGAGLVIIALAALIWFLVRRRRAAPDHSAVSKEPKRRSLFGKSPKSPGSNTTVSELLGDKRQPTEVPADSAHSRFELPGSAPLEMPAAEVSPAFFQDPQNRNGTMQRNNPMEPAELAQRQREAKEAEAAAYRRRNNSASPVPPYTPAETNPRLSNSVSPYSPRHSQAFGTVSSGEQGISPVGNSSGNASQRNSNSVPSPVSPEATMARGFQRHTQPSEPGSNESHSPHVSYGPHLTPSLVGRAPSRSPSRGSRFVEEGLSTDHEEHNSSSRSARFSWED